MKTPVEYQPFLPWKNLPPEELGEYCPDDRSGAVYHEDEKLRFVTEVAIVTQRPLLLRGEPGSGKSSFAPFVARNLKWRYYEQTVTGRTEAKDLLWRYDALRRLRDARGDGKDDMAALRYVTPGPLWWAFNRKKALELYQGAAGAQGSKAGSAPVEPFAELNRKRDPLRAVVLIDELDKADPNVPNDLLEVLGTNRFRVDEVENLTVSREAVLGAGPKSSANKHGTLLTVITTNQERDLPAAFIRRCVVHTLGEPQTEEEKIKRLVDIALLHMSPLIGSDSGKQELIQQIAKRCIELRGSEKSKRQRGPSIAEFLDAARFCLVQNLSPDHDEWQVVKQSVLLKREQD